MPVWAYVQKHIPLFAHVLSHVAFYLAHAFDKAVLAFHVRKHMRKKWNVLLHVRPNWHVRKHIVSALTSWRCCARRTSRLSGRCLSAAARASTDLRARARAPEGPRARTRAILPFTCKTRARARESEEACAATLKQRPDSLEVRADPAQGRNRRVKPKSKAKETSWHFGISAKSIPDFTFNKKRRRGYQQREDAGQARAVTAGGGPHAEHAQDVPAPVV